MVCFASKLLGNLQLVGELGVVWVRGEGYVGEVEQRILMRWSVSWVVGSGGWFRVVINT